MSKRASRKIAVSLVLIAFAVTAPPLVSANTAIDENSKPADSVQLGPVLRLADQEVWDTRLVVSPDGHAHIVLFGNSGVSYVLVDGTTVHAAEPVGPSGAKNNNFAASLAGDGALHVVINEQHYTRTGERWADPVAGPPCVALTVSAGRLVCAMVVSGSDVNAPRRWTWFGFGGYPAAIIFPWHVESEKLVLLQLTETGWTDPIAVDASTKYDVDSGELLAHLSIAGDDSGVVHVVYVPYGSILGVPNPQPNRYAEVKFTARKPSPPPANTSAAAGSTRQVESVDSSELALKLEGKNQRVSIAVDPPTGDGLIVAQGQGVPKGGSLMSQIHDMLRDLNHAFTVHDSTVSAAFSFAGDAFKIENTKAVMFSQLAPHVYLAAAGKGRYHVVVAWSAGHFPVKLTLYYLSYQSGTWSTPVLLGSSTTAPYNPVQLGSAASNRLFVSWADDQHKPVGRWITLGE